MPVGCTGCAVRCLIFQSRSLIYPQTHAGVEARALTCLAVIPIHDEVVFRIFDITWCVAFVVELFLRIFADGKMFFSTSNPE